jgi:hypothetical protein
MGYQSKSIRERYIKGISSSFISRQHQFTYASLLRYTYLDIHLVPYSVRSLVGLVRQTVAAS